MHMFVEYWPTLHSNVIHTPAFIYCIKPFTLIWIQFSWQKALFQICMRYFVRKLFSRNSLGIAEINYNHIYHLMPTLITKIKNNKNSYPGNWTKIAQYTISLKKLEIYFITLSKYVHSLPVIQQIGIFYVKHFIGF